MKKLLFIILGLALVGGAGWWWQSRFNLTAPTSAGVSFPESYLPDGVSGGNGPDTVVSGLVVPWEVVFLPAGDMLVTQRSGDLIWVRADGLVTIPVAGVQSVGEGGLLGLALHPDFAQNGWLYLYLTSSVGQSITNRVERYRWADGQLAERNVLVDGIIGSSIHDGGRLAFGPDGYLYLTTGDAGMTSLAQDTASLNGKILRIGDDGSIPPDNPFGTPVYSWGHRNPQGLAWDDQGRLWATEHGRSGVRSGFDELNLIVKGANYGWPVIQGDEQREGMVAPVIHSGSTETWAPAGAAYFDGRIFFVGLRGETLYEYHPETGQLEKNFSGRFGRLRAVVLGPDGMMYITTSNQDGRGRPEADDDRVMMIDPQALVNSENL